MNTYCISCAGARSLHNPVGTAEAVGLKMLEGEGKQKGTCSRRSYWLIKHPVDWAVGYSAPIECVFFFFLGYQTAACLKALCNTDKQRKTVKSMTVSHRGLLGSSQSSKVAPLALTSTEKIALFVKDTRVQGGLETTPCTKAAINDWRKIHSPKNEGILALERPSQIPQISVCERWMMREACKEGCICLLRPSPLCLLIPLWTSDRVR